MSSLIELVDPALQFGPLWMAIRHYLQPTDFHYVLSGLITSSTNGQNSISDLFEVEFFGIGTIIETSIYKEKPVESRKLKAIQTHVQNLIWVNGDLDVAWPPGESIPEAFWAYYAGLSIGNLSYYDDDILADYYDWQNRVDVVTREVSQCILNFGRLETEESGAAWAQFESITGRLPAILGWLIRKHVVDSLARRERWLEASAYYRALGEQVANIVGLESPYFEILTSAAKLSLNRSLKGERGPSNEAIAAYLPLLSMPLQTAPVLLANGSFDAMIANLSRSLSERVKEPIGDLRAAVYRAPIAIEEIEHRIKYCYGALNRADIESGLRRCNEVAKATFAQGYSEGYREVMRIQAQLHLDLFAKSGVENSIFQALAASVLAENADAFARLRIPRIPSTVLKPTWLDELATLSELNIQRKLVMVSILRKVIEWTDDADVRDKVFDVLLKYAQFPASVEGSYNLGGDAIEAVKAIAGVDRRLSQAKGTDFVEFVTSTLLERKTFWRAYELTLEACVAYAPSLTTDQIICLSNAILEFLDQFPEDHDGEPYIRPAVEFFLVSQVKNALKAASKQGEVLDKTIRYIRNGQTINLFAYLSAWDKREVDRVHEYVDISKIVEEKFEIAQEGRSSQSSMALSDLAIAYNLLSVNERKRLLNTILDTLKAVITEKRTPFGFTGLYGPVNILVDRFLSEDHGADLEILRSGLKDICATLTDIWHYSVGHPSIFSAFSFGLTEKPSEAQIYQWGMASLRLAQATALQQTMLQALSHAMENPSLRSTIMRARAASMAIYEQAAETTGPALLELLLSASSKQDFYRVATMVVPNLSLLDENWRTKLSSILIDRALRFGPHVVDGLIFSTALFSLEHLPRVDEVAIDDYRQRLRDNKELADHLGMMISFIEYRQRNKPGSIVE